LFRPFLPTHVSIESPQKATVLLRRGATAFMALAFLAPPVAMAAWTSPQQQQHHQRVLGAEPSLQPKPATEALKQKPESKQWDVLMIAIDDLRSELSCSGPTGFQSLTVHTPHLCGLAQDSLMLLRSQVRPWQWNHASRPEALTPYASSPHAVTPSGNHGDLRAFACIDLHQSAPVDHPCL
jgi:hypothetical protein